MDVTEGLIWLCGHAVRGQIPQKELASKLDLNALYKVASRNMLAAMVGMTLMQVGIKDPKFEKAIQIAQYKALIMDAEQDKIFRKMDEREIWHVGLKGAELKKWYPKFAMRERADIDILFDSRHEETVKEIMNELGYQCRCYGTGHHDVYAKDSDVCVEMHVALFGVEYEEYLNQYFADYPERLVRTNGWEREFSPEDLYVYFIAHNYNHYVNEGVGVRALLDEFVFLNKYAETLKWPYVEKELEKLGMAEFEKTFKVLAKKCFENEFFSRELLTEDELKILDYMVASGSHGSVGNKVENWIRGGGGGFRGRVKYVWRRLFLPKDVVEHWFPFFYKHKILLPFLPIYRTVKGFWGNGKKISAEWKAFRR